MRAMGIHGLKINQFTRSRHDFNSLKKKNYNTLQATRMFSLCSPESCTVKSLSCAVSQGF